MREQRVTECRAETDAVLSRIDEVLERAYPAPALGDPDVVLESYGFPEPLCDGRLPPVMAGVLRTHLHVSRGQ